MSAIVRFERIHSDAKLPSRATPGSAGLDLCACESLTVYPGETKAARLGLRVALPDGFEGQVRPRSGLAARHEVTVLNAPGTIDADFRGELQVLLVNHGLRPFSVSTGDRIAQLVIQKLPPLLIEEGPVDETSTARGAGGFGSTGR